MASTNRGSSGSAAMPKREQALLVKDTLPLAMALSSLAILLLAFFVGDVAPSSQATSAAGTASGERQPLPPNMARELPADLLPDRIPLPRFPDSSELEAPVPDPAEETPSNAESEIDRLVLASLRTESVPTLAPALAQVALVTHDTPGRLTPGTISSASFEPGLARRTRRGWGGIGIGGSGGGLGGLGSGGGGCSGAPAGGIPGIIIERLPRLFPN